MWWLKMVLFDKGSQEPGPFLETIVIHNFVVNAIEKDKIRIEVLDIFGKLSKKDVAPKLDIGRRQEKRPQQGRNKFLPDRNKCLSKC